MSYSISIDDSMLLGALLRSRAKRGPGDKLEEKKLWIDQEAFNWMSGGFPLGWLRLNIFLLDEMRGEEKKSMCLKKQRKWHFLSTWICDLTFIHFTFLIKVEEAVWETLGKGISTQKLSFIGPVANVKIKDTKDWSSETGRVVISQESCRL